MRRLRRRRRPPHHLPHQIRANHARIRDHLRRNVQRAPQHLVGAITQLAEQAVEEAVPGRVDGARRAQVQRARKADQLGQEEGAAGFHDEAPPREDEADFGLAVGDADGHGERHRDADADGGALQGADGGLAAAVDGEDDAAAACVGVLVGGFCSLGLLWWWWRRE